MKKIFCILTCFCVLGFAKTIQIDVTKVIPLYEKQASNTNCDVSGSSDENNILGTVIGGVAGGVLGNQIGGGTGKTIATIVGATAGGYTGNKVQGNMKSKNNCDNTTQREVLTGYKNIGYYNGKEYYEISNKKLNSITIEVR
ncbi:glycine zipper 2TM domain-containing protein [Campylobacter sp. RM12327]|uniref:glycine zipper 2TM domain-containing protein n=1 Tax=Campylobacter sputorum TaxID=206 RepID=UPI000B77587B|nr:MULTISPECIES: glycine zipper 2TM domain-containing protein [Campylobacter]ASM39907.1 hypothetical protein CSPB_0674 [Campylobacter sputorum]MBE7357558.1 glycine zipper 2TM domain-containing protein [Campylobacter sp. RM11302]MBF6669140.1 glycine zipper 2TM domain-containing protein [Campylobacter sp. RM12327]MBF6674384.1 glycine zipper 2TM domain-containing protein [Campylobacter sp. RM13538]MBF6675425.1 glycine zipper 2TM domain-containing protein [Campylobacter sp. RM12321]